MAPHFPFCPLRCISSLRACNVSKSFFPSTKERSRETNSARVPWKERKGGTASFSSNWTRSPFRQSDLERSLLNSSQSETDGNKCTLTARRKEAAGLFASTLSRDQRAEDKTTSFDAESAQNQTSCQLGRLCNILMCTLLAKLHVKTSFKSLAREGNYISRA